MKFEQTVFEKCFDNVCDGSGFLYDEAKRQARPCSCRRRRIARRKARKLEGVIPLRYRGMSFGRPPVSEMSKVCVAPVKEYLDRLEENLDDGSGLWFIGPAGTGKTTLAMLVSATALQRGHSVAIYSLPQLLTMLRSSFDDSSEETLVSLLDRLAAVDLLHIDDIGTEQTSEWVLEQLYTIINSRYEDKRAVIATTNLDIDQLSKQIGVRVVSRLIEMSGDPIPMFGTDHRWEAKYAARCHVPTSELDELNNGLDKFKASTGPASDGFDRTPNTDVSSGSNPAFTSSRKTLYDRHNDGNEQTAATREGFGSDQYRQPPNESDQWL